MNNRGMVLITVLWVVLVISFISLSLAAAVRVEMRAAADSFESEKAFYMAKSAAEVVFQELKTPGILKGSPVSQDGSLFVVPFDSGEARIHLESTVGLIDINGASDKLLASMFDSMGVDGSLRNEIVDSIMDWRDADDVPLQNGAEVADYGQVLDGPRRLPANAGFATLDELLLVKHMTAGVFFGHIEYDPGDNTYRRTRGLRELLTVASTNRFYININEASAEVLAALPGMNADLAARILSERALMAFQNESDLVARVASIKSSEVIEYVNTASAPPTGIVSVASVQPSGASRTVRLDFIRERKKQILMASPLIYKDIEVIKFGSWRY